MPIQHHSRKRLCRYGLRSLIVLEDGVIIEGCGFGSPGIRVGEMVFTTGMVGYPEALTDPSFEGQILIMTHPLIGNYGVPSTKITEYGLPLHYESDRIHVEALIVAYETNPSHWTSSKSLHEWLVSENIPGISDVDTRMLVKHIREKGVMMAAIAVYNYSEDVNAEYLFEILKKTTRYDYLNLVDRVSPSRPIAYTPNKHWRETILVIDCGVKYGILRELLRRKFRVIRIPCKENPVEYLHEYNAKGVVFSNGPGNPIILKDTIKHAQNLIEYEIPVLGICLGHQILALAAGGRTYKLRYGHRGQNKPCIDVESGKCFVTSQNHGFAVDADSLKDTGFKIWMINADDKTIEGLKHVTKPIITTQFHPEASPGPLDTSWIFDLFRKMVERHGTSI